jgi:hypothetical protein
MHGDSSQRAVGEFDFSRVHDRPRPEAECLVLAIDVASEANRSRGRIEAGEETVTGAVNLNPPCIVSRRDTSA